MSLSDKLRKRLNDKQKDNEKPIATSFKSTDNLMQVASWIPLKPFFKQASGGDGFPCGHITQIIGRPDSGKSTLMMEGMVSCQKLGGVVFFIDSEHKFSLQRFELMGGKAEELVIMQVDTLESAWDAIDKALMSIKEERDEKNDSPMMICWDSIAASVPQKVMDDESGDAHMALEAKLNNKNIRKLKASIMNSNTCCVFINHYYMTVPKSRYEPSELVIKGGEELTFLSTLIIKTKQGAKIERDIKGETQKLGRITRFEIHKGHFHGRTIVKDVYVVDKGILESKEDFDEYKKDLRGSF